MKRKIKTLLSLLLVFSIVLGPCCYAYADSEEVQPGETDEFQLNSEDENIETIQPEDADISGEEPEDEAVDSVSGDEEQGINRVMDAAEGEEIVDAAAAASSKSYQGSATDDSGNFANLVVFVNFADTVHNHEESVWGECYEKKPNLTGLFQGDDAHPRAMKQYLKNISYGQLEVANIFPQYDKDTKKIHPYTLKNNTDYYANDTLNGDAHIIQEVTEILASSGQIPPDINLDRNGENGDGCVDNLMIIVACESGNKNEKFYGHKATYPGSETVNSKKIANYTLLPESDVYLGMSQSGVVIHEFLHTLGCPDLYIVNNTVTGRVPVGQWDIMATVSMYPQYPLAYFRSEYLKWFSIPTITDSKQKCSIYAASAATEATKNNQAVILKTDYSSSEFFVLEYRKKGVQDSVDSTKQDYDCKIPGSGLVIYRVNLGVKVGNASAPPYMVYVFGENDTYDEKGYEKADYGRMETSFLSAESKRTSFGSSDPKATLSDNALTYSDGTNSGIVISNVGSAEGDQITFDVTFSEDESIWKMESEDTLNLQMSTLDSCRSENGDLYYIVQKNYSSGTSLLECSGGKWSQVAECPKGSGHKIAMYGGEIYTVYLDSSTYCVKLAKWEGGSWKELFTSTDTATEAAIEGSSDGIYITYANQSGDSVYAHKYSKETGVKQLGSKAASSSGFAANAKISSEDGNTFIIYREANNNNLLYVKQYNEKTDSWSSVLNDTMQGNSAYIKQKNGLLYLLKNGTTWGNNGSYVYVYDTKSPGNGWTQMGSNTVTDSNVSEADICFNGSVPYIGYYDGKGKTCVMEYKGNQWTQLGASVSNQNLSGLKLYDGNNKIYATYLDSVTGRVVVRSFPIEEQKDVEIGSVVLNKNSCTLNIGGSEQLTAEIKPSNATGSRVLEWSSSDGSVASVDSNGKVTGKKAGSAVITVKTSNGKTASCTVNVVDTKDVEISSVVLNKNSCTLNIGDSEQLTAEIKPSNATGSRVLEWSSSDGSVASVDSNGKVTGKKAGSAVITVKTSNGKTASCTVNVVDTKDEEDTRWKQDAKGYWYQNPDGSYPRNQWKEIDGYWYHFNASGYRETGWRRLGKVWYYMQPDGKMVTGPQTIEGKEYCFDASGAMLTGWQKRDGDWYYYTSDGAMSKKVWKKVKGIWYYFEKTGKMVTGPQMIGDYEYYFNDGGAMLTGWQKRDGIWYYYSSSGAMVKGAWKKIKGSWYYLKLDGRMVTGLQTIGGKEYSFNDGGAMQTGWQKRGNDWYYYGSDGAMVKGAWKRIKRTWYYMQPDGKMVTGAQTIEGKEYYFNASGAMQTGWKKRETDWYYYASDGSMVKSKWLRSGKSWYYLKEDGKMAASEWIEGYYLSASGRMV